MLQLPPSTAIVWGVKKLQHGASCIPESLSFLPFPWQHGKTLCCNGSPDPRIMQEENLHESNGPGCTQEIRHNCHTHKVRLHSIPVITQESRSHMFWIALVAYQNMWLPRPGLSIMEGQSYVAESIQPFRGVSRASKAQQRSPTSHLISKLTMRYPPQ